MSPLSVLVSSLLAAATSAQTFVVDAGNGPGTNYTDLPTAVASVPSGSTLLVRAGSYAGFTLTQKQLAVRGIGAVNVTGTCTVQSTQAPQTVELRGLAWPTSRSGTTQLACMNCAGLVQLENLSLGDVVHDNCPLSCTRGPALDIAGCSEVFVGGCTLRGNTQVQSSHVVFDADLLQGEDVLLITGSGGIPQQLAPARPALTLLSGDAQSTSTMQGGWARNWGLGFRFDGADGVVLGVTASMRLLSGSVADGSYFLAPSGPPPVPIHGTITSILRIDPGVTLVSSSGPVVRNAPAVIQAMPRLEATDGMAPGSVSATAHVPAGHACVLLLGFLGPPLQLPGIDDAFWLQPAAYLFAAFGVPLGGQPLTTTIAVPTAPNLIGFRLGWQAVSIDPVSGAMQGSNPQISMVL